MAIIKISRRLVMVGMVDTSYYSQLKILTEAIFLSLMDSKDSFFDVYKSISFHEKQLFCLKRWYNGYGNRVPKRS